MLTIGITKIDVSSVTNYMDAITRLGARYIVGPSPSAEECDGLLIPGGVDVDPARYGQAPVPEDEIDLELDQVQFAVLDQFLALGKPVFGICRGHQLLNVAFGGTLIQHLPNAADHVWTEAGDHIHACDAEPGSFMDRLYGRHFVTNSAHHQAVDIPAPGMKVVLRSADGVIEAMEHESLPVWCVQWHPERMCFGHARPDTVDGSKVIQFFLEKCAH